MTDEEREEVRAAIPERFRASTAAADKAAYELLQLNDEKQKELAEKINTPFTTHSPKDRQRTSALVTIKTYEEMAKYETLSPSLKEELADAYASIGQYEKAKSLTLDNVRRAEYIKYHNAVWLDDDDWCSHGEQSKYIKDHVWSIREGKEMPLLACNECGMWNVLDAPERLMKMRSLRAEIRAAQSKMSEPEFLDFIEKYKRRML